jgi:hypothetical protein
MDANRALGTLITSTLTLGGGVLTYTGVVGIIRRRLPKLLPGSYYEGRAALYNGVLRTVVGGAVMGLGLYVLAHLLFV